ncbi:uncharacterized protein [Dermacentor andersoni]|uniref:uncharacterized protein n=1 Tax=Dermacentor andersoni TaxID=34620 RepID=UPI003B3B57B9
MKARVEDRVIYSPYGNIEIPVCSFYTLVRQRLLVNPDKIALVNDVVSLTRAEMLAGMERYAVGFRQHGVLPGDRICIHLDNGVENLLAMYGCILAGASIVLAKTSLTERELRYQAEDGDCTHVITDEQYTTKVNAAVANLNMKALFCMGRSSGFVSASQFSKLDEKDFHECPIADPKKTLLALCYTSGSTGLPKGAEITHYNYVAAFYSMSTPSECNAKTYVGVEAISFGSANYGISSHLGAPDNTCKGIIRNIDLERDHERLNSLIVLPKNPKALEARRIKDFTMVVILFDSLKMPNYVMCGLSACLNEDLGSDHNIVATSVNVKSEPLRKFTIADWDQFRKIRKERAQS